MSDSIFNYKASNKIDKKLIKSLQFASSEKGGEHAYWDAISTTFKVSQPSDSQRTDGFIELQFSEREIFLLMEFKYQAQLNKRANALRVLIQSLFYIRNLRENTAKTPNMVLIGDQEHAFVISSKPLLKYLDNSDIDWSVSPSEAPRKYASTLLVDLENDGDIRYYLHKISEKFTFNDLINDIQNLSSDNGTKIKLTESNISIAFERFICDIIVDPSAYSAEELVSLFLTIAIDRESVFESSTGNKLSINGREINVKKANYLSFISHFDQNYKPSEKRKFTAISDRLIFDLERRSNGEFYTPSSFVEFSQKRLEKYIGKNWRNEFVVWDPAWGTGNLTRDYKFEKLYASTLNQSDLDQGQQYNAGSEKFVFNFLEDDFNFEDDSLFIHETDKLPSSLVNILINHPTTNFLFYLNPPYATAGNANSSSSRTKTGISKSKIQDEMREKKLKVQEQLYAQFLYRIIKLKQKLNLTNVYIGLFSPSLFLTGSKFDKFRELLLSEFKFLEGNIFQASNFADVKSNWAIDFTIWKSIEPSSSLPQYEFVHNVLSVDEIGNVQIIDTKKLWNTDNPELISLQDFLIQYTEKPVTETKNVIQFKSRYKSENVDVCVPQNAIGYIINDTNNIEASNKGVYLMSSPIKRHIKTAMITENTFDYQMIVFASRKVVKPTWRNQKDEFLAPDINNPKFQELKIKSVIYSIFSPNNNIISYRKGYLNFNCDNLNPWFFMYPEEIRELADEFNNDQIFDDAISHSSIPYVTRFLEENKNYLDDKDNELLNLSKQIIKDSFKFRNIVNDDEPELSVNTWDASWHQITSMSKRFDLDNLEKFNILFKDYCNDIEQLVYKNNILRE